MSLQNPNLSSHVALITGASKGIGKNVAITLAKYGCSVAILARSVDKLQEVAKQCEVYHDRILVVPCDVIDRKQIEASVNKIIEHFGKITILVNNAGVNGRVPIYKSDPYRFDKIIQVNQLATMHFTARISQHMMTHPKDSLRAIIFINSSAVRIAGRHGLSAYYSSKYGVNGFSLSASKDIRATGHNIKVSCLQLGLVNTDMGTRGFLLMQPKEMLQTEDISRTILFILSQPRNTNIEAIDLIAHTDYNISTNKNGSKL